MRSRIGLYFLASTALWPQQYLISTYAGGVVPPVRVIPALQASLHGALTIAADSSGKLYFTLNNAAFSLDVGGTITRIVGTGAGGFSGDGGPATNARLLLGSQLYTPGPGLAVDPAGSLFIGDIGNHRVRKVSPNGIIATVAGNGVSGFSGDGGPATDAQLGQPSGLAIDRSGNLYIADVTFNVIRKVSVSGIITTVAGIASTEPGFSGDGGPATSAKLALPWTIALDLNDNLFIADSLNFRIRRVSIDGRIVTVAGNGTRDREEKGSLDSGPATSIELFTPNGIALDDRGNLFISDGGFPVIRKVTPDGALTPVVGNGTYGFSGDGGPAGKAQLGPPGGCAMDGRNNLFVVDGDRIRKVLASGNIDTVAGGGNIDLLAVEGDTDIATNAQMKLAIPNLAMQSGIVTDINGNVYFAESASGLVRKISPGGSITTVAGGGSCTSQSVCPLGDGGPATSAHLSLPTSVAVDGRGNLFIEGQNRVRKASPDGIITTVAGNGTSGSSGDGGLATDAQIVAYGGVAVDGAGNLFIADVNRVRKVSPEGIITTVVVVGACAGPSCDVGPSAVVVGACAGPSCSSGPLAVAVDGSGDLLIGDIEGDDFDCYNYIRKVSAGGIVDTLAGVPGPCRGAGDGGPAASAALGYTTSIAVDHAGNIFLTDPIAQRIRRISPDGIIATVAGGQYGYSGDGGPAVNAALNYPTAVAADAGGNVYFSDAFNDVIRVLRPVNHPTLTAVVDGASQAPDSVSPGKIVLIYGAGLGPASLTPNQPASLPGGVGFGSVVGGTTVKFNSISAAILYASATQLAVLAPYGLGGTTAQVQVTYLGDVSNTFSVPLAGAAPSLFTLNQSGSGQAVAINASNGKANTAANPVKVGDYISLYATGEGQTIPAGVDGRLSSTPTRPVRPVSVTVAGIPAQVQYAGGAPGQVAGLMQVNVQIPSGVQPGGYVPVVLQVGDSSTTPGAVWIAVTN
jgi:uncharacterized protein (TIGR03437 family)